MDFNEHSTGSLMKIIPRWCQFQLVGLGGEWGSGSTIMINPAHIISVKDLVRSVRITMVGGNQYEVIGTLTEVMYKLPSHEEENNE